SSPRATLMTRNPWRASMSVSNWRAYSSSSTTRMVDAFSPSGAGRASPQGNGSTPGQRSPCFCPFGGGCRRPAIVGQFGGDRSSDPNTLLLLEQRRGEQDLASELHHRRVLVLARLL